MCANSPKRCTSSDFSLYALAKTDIDMVVEVHLRETYAICLTLRVHSIR